MSLLSFVTGNAARIRRLVGSHSLLIVMLTQSAARAEGPADVAVAEVLFRDARELVAAGKLVEACPKFAESQRLDPAPGTLLNLGDCYERSGLFASAWGAYEEAAAVARRAGARERAETGTALAREIEAKVPYIVLVVSPSSDFPELVIKRNGTPVPRSQWSTSIPIDPGAYLIEASGSGRKSFTARVEIAAPASPDRRTTTVDIPPLAPDETPAAPSSALRRSASSTQRTLGIVSGVTGLAVLIAASAVGLVALDRYSDASDAGCNDDACWTPRGRELTVESRQLATASSWLFFAGGTLAATGGILFATAPAGSSTKTGFVLGAQCRW